jgi:hypothetical protein
MMLTLAHSGSAGNPFRRNTARALSLAGCA